MRGNGCRCVGDFLNPSGGGHDIAAQLQRRRLQGDIQRRIGCRRDRDILECPCLGADALHANRITPRRDADHTVPPVHAGRGSETRADQGKPGARQRHLRAVGDEARKRAGLRHDNARRGQHRTQAAQRESGAAVTDNPSDTEYCRGDSTSN